MQTSPCPPAGGHPSPNRRGVRGRYYFMRILLIEDDLFFQKFYARKLTENNFTVDTAVDGNEGILKMQQQKPNIVLLDLIMPNKDGFAVLSFRASDPSLQLIPVIVFSTLGQEQDIHKALQMGASDYVYKSFFDFSMLLNKIHTVISGQSKPQ